MNVDLHPKRILSLYAGVGWLDEGLQLGLEFLALDSRIVAYVERDAYAASVLLARMADASLEYAPISDSIGDIDERFRGCVDFVVAGFPCQPWSHAGKKQGTEDDRWLWPEIADCIRRLGPRFVFLENVPGLISGGGLEHVLSDLAAIGFDAEWGCLTAEAVGAAHRRKRVFILAVARGFSSAGWRVAGDVAGTSRAAEKNGEQRQRLRNSVDDCESAVAHAEFNGGRIDEPGRGSNRRAAVGRHSAELAQPTRGGLRESRQPSERGGLTDGGDEAVEFPQSQRTQVVPGWQSERLQFHDGRDTSVGDADSARPQGSTGAPDADWGIFAPGPNADWRGVPDSLWPAIPKQTAKSELLRLADGRHVLLDISRADRLRCAGNGCVALQAAAAFVELVRRIKEKKPCEKNC